ncbi:hypothetical protein [Peribacillus butanolivorans]
MTQSIIGTKSMVVSPRYLASMAGIELPTTYRPYGLIEVGDS